MSERITFEKDPDAVLDYELDWSTWLGSDTLTSATWSVQGNEPDPPVINSQTILAGNKVTRVWLQGGELGEDYSLRCRIVTAGGRTEDRTVKFKIRSK